MAETSPKEIDPSKETVNLKEEREEKKVSSRSISADMFEDGATFANYRIIRKVARGAMGVVYLAKDELLERDVALKVILTMPGMKASDEQVERFLREAKSIARLRHKNIVPVYEVSVSDDCHYFTMEFIQGPTLEQYMLKDELTNLRAVEIVREIADGLVAAHEKNIVHRDIKPANILLENGETPMITDFGLAKLTEAEQRLTMTGSMLGTPCYMSPEQANGESDIDQRSDLFSLGIILYEMVTGKLPFKGEAYMKTILKVIEGNYILPRKLNPKLSRDVENIIRKALEKDKTFRYQSAMDLRDDCDRFLRGEVVSISKTGIYRKAMRKVYHNKYSIMLSSLAIGVIAFLVYLIITLYQDGQQLSKDSREQYLSVQNENKKISRDKALLEIQGELLKKGSITPEFVEGFEDAAIFDSNWSSRIQKPHIHEKKAILPAGKPCVLTPKAIRFSPSLVIRSEMNLPLDGQVNVMLGRFKAKSEDVFQSAHIIHFHMMGQTEERFNASGERLFLLKLQLFQASTKEGFSFHTDADEVLRLAGNPLAEKHFWLPVSLQNKLVYLIKKHETFIEVKIQDDDDVYGAHSKLLESFKVCHASFLTGHKNHISFHFFGKNQEPFILKKLRVDKWNPGTFDLEIGRILEFNGRDDFKNLREDLDKFDLPLEITLSNTDNVEERWALQYQLARSAFLKGLITSRFVHYKPGSEKGLEEVEAYFNSSAEKGRQFLQAHHNVSKTEYKNHFDLLRSSLSQLMSVYILLGKWPETRPVLNEYMKLVSAKSLADDWFWMIPAVLDERLAYVKQYKSKAYEDELLVVLQFLKLFQFSREEGYLIFSQYVKSLLMECQKAKRLDLMKEAYLILEDTSYIIIYEDMFKEFLKDKAPNEKPFQMLTQVNELFGVEEDVFLSSLGFYTWQLPQQAKLKNSEWSDQIKQKLGAYRSAPWINYILSIFENFSEIQWNSLNKLVNEKQWAKEVITLYQEEDNLKKLLKSNENIQQFGDVFPVDLKMNNQRGGNIHLSRTVDGLRVRIITTDSALENENIGKALVNGDSWELFFDFRRGNEFLSPNGSAGFLRIIYAPAMNQRGFSLYDPNQLVEVLDFRSGFSQQAEITLLLSFQRLKAFLKTNELPLVGFNALLNLEEKGKKDIKRVFDGNYQIFYLEKATAEMFKMPELLNKDLKYQVIYQQAEDDYGSKVLFKRIVDDWLGVQSKEPLATPYQLEQFLKAFQTSFETTSKKGDLTDINGVLQDIKLMKSLLGHADELKIFCAQMMINALDSNLTSLKYPKSNRYIKVYQWKDYLREWQLFREQLDLKHLEKQGLVSYLKVYEEALNFAKADPIRWQEFVQFVSVLPFDDLRPREKSMLLVYEDNLPDAVYEMRKYFFGKLWKMDYRAWFDYQIIYQLSEIKGFSFMFSDKVPQNVVSSYERHKSMFADVLRTLSGQMNEKEFRAKYIDFSSYYFLIMAFKEEIKINYDKKSVRNYYESFLRYNKDSFLKHIIQRQLKEVDE